MKLFNQLKEWRFKELKKKKLQKKDVLQEYLGSNKNYIKYNKNQIVQNTTQRQSKCVINGTISIIQSKKERAKMDDEIKKKQQERLNKGKGNEKKQSKK